MEKYILLFAVIFCCYAPVFAQNTPKYCDLLVYRPAFKNYIAELHIDSNSMPARCILRKTDGSKMKFASAIDALNYVVKQGWELANVYNVHNEGTHFILIRK